jgi:hypothetical protein
MLDHLVGISSHHDLFPSLGVTEIILRGRDQSVLQTVVYVAGISGGRLGIAQRGYQYPKGTLLSRDHLFLVDNAHGYSWAREGDLLVPEKGRLRAAVELKTSFEFGVRSDLFYYLGQEDGSLNLASFSREGEGFECKNSPINSDYTSLVLGNKPTFF